MRSDRTTWDERQQNLGETQARARQGPSFKNGDAREVREHCV